MGCLLNKQLPFQGLDQAYWSHLLGRQENSVKNIKQIIMDLVNGKSEKLGPGDLLIVASRCVNHCEPCLFEKFFSIVRKNRNRFGGWSWKGGLWFAYPRIRLWSLPKSGISWHKQYGHSQSPKNESNATCKWLPLFHQGRDLSETWVSVEWERLFLKKLGPSLIL